MLALHPHVVTSGDARHDRVSEFEMFYIAIGDADAASAPSKDRFRDANGYSIAKNPVCVHDMRATIMQVVRHRPRGVTYRY